MINRPGKWWALGVTLTVMWTLVVITYGWINLPRAHQMSHDPQLLGNLSNAASAIFRGPAEKARPVRGAPVWSEDPRILRMSNGTRLTFPAITTDAQAALVASEYRQLLDVEADRQRGTYLLEMLAIWLASLLLAGLAIRVVRRGYEPALELTRGPGGRKTFCA